MYVRIHMLYLLRILIHFSTCNYKKTTVLFGHQESSLSLKHVRVCVCVGVGVWAGGWVGGYIHTFRYWTKSEDNSF